MFFFMAFQLGKTRASLVMLSSSVSMTDCMGLMCDIAGFKEEVNDDSQSVWSTSKSFKSKRQRRGIKLERDEDACDDEVGGDFDETDDDDNDDDACIQSNDSSSRIGESMLCIVC
jgi:hypothetical protein